MHWTEPEVYCVAETKINDFATFLRRAWPLIKKDFQAKFKGWHIKITCGHRPPEIQFSLYKKGRKYSLDKKRWVLEDASLRVTNRDGYDRLSDHNYYPSNAFDVALRNPQNDYTWDYKLPQWQYMEPLAKKYGVLNGSKWKSPHDPPHFYII